MNGSNSENDPSLLRRLTGHRGEVTGLSFHPDCMQLASSSTDSNLILWNLKKHAHAIKFETHSDQVTDVFFFPNAKAFASSSKDRTLRLWKPSIKSRCKVVTAHTSAVRSVHVSADSTHLLSASNDKNIKMWISEYSNKFISTFHGHTHWVNCARFSLDGKNVVSCSEDKTAKLWDRNTNSLVYTYEEKVIPKYVEFHPNNKCFGVAFTNGDTKIYDIRNHKLLQLYVHKQSVNKLTFHPSGNFFITGSSDGLVNVYDILEGRKIYTLEGHNGAVTALAFSPDGERFATAGADKTVFVWNTNFYNQALAKPLKSGSRTVDGRLSCMGTEQPEMEVSSVLDSPSEEKNNGFHSLSTDNETFHSVKTDTNENPLVAEERKALRFSEPSVESNETFHSCIAVSSSMNGGGDATADNNRSVLERVSALKLVVKNLQGELEKILEELEAIVVQQNNTKNS